MIVYAPVSVFRFGIDDGVDSVFEACARGMQIAIRFDSSFHFRVFQLGAERAKTLETTHIYIAILLC
jgi:hypothetical protein